MTIPEPEKYEEGRIPEKVASTLEEEPEEKPFLISFLPYKEKLCGIENLEKNGPRRALIALRNIGSKISSIKQFHNFGINEIPVANSNEYRVLFNGLSPDLELKEHKLSRDERMFYFIDNVDRIFNIIAITKRHFETDKVRR